MFICVYSLCGLSKPKPKNNGNADNLYVESDKNVPIKGQEVSIRGAENETDDICDKDDEMLNDYEMNFLFQETNENVSINNLKFVHDKIINMHIAT